MVGSLFGREADKEEEKVVSDLTSVLASSELALRVEVTGVAKYSSEDGVARLLAGAETDPGLCVAAAACPCSEAAAILAGDEEGRGVGSCRLASWAAAFARAFAFAASTTACKFAGKTGGRVGLRGMIRRHMGQDLRCSIHVRRQ